MNDNSDPEVVYREVCSRGLWPQLYHRIREETKYNDLSTQDSRLPDFRSRNRYRDVSPYDHTRIHLQRHNINYINANWVEVPEADRAYILTQGPLPHTASHFWLMAWEQDCRAIVMLNNVIEKGFIKCHQYFPMGAQNEDDDELYYDDVGLKVTFLKETKLQNFVIRHLQLVDRLTDQVRDIQQFHYFAWPDFGVPESPRAFLDLLQAVRASGALSSDVGPVIVHCSAGIGRSGTFCLVDSALVLAHKYGSLKEVDVLKLMMKTRRYRMGLIQSHDQLRFMFEAILEGARTILNRDVGYPGDVVKDIKDIGEDGFSISNLIPHNIEHEHPIIMRQNAVPGNNHKLDNEWREESRTSSFEGEGEPAQLPVDSLPKTEQNEASTSVEETELRRRKREERIKNTQSMIDKMKQKQKAMEENEQFHKQWRPYYIVGVSLVVVFGAYLCHHFFM